MWKPLFCFKVRYFKLSMCYLNMSLLVYGMLWWKDLAVFAELLLLRMHSTLALLLSSVNFLTKKYYPLFYSWRTSTTLKYIWEFWNKIVGAVWIIRANLLSSFCCLFWLNSILHKFQYFQNFAFLSKIWSSRKSVQYAFTYLMWICVH